MTVTSDKLLLFKSHECSKGLSNEALKEISDAAELVQFDSGEYLHRANEPMTSVYLVVHGRLRQALVDMHGNDLLLRFLTCGMQFGALGAAQAEPIPVNVVAQEPSALLKLDFQKVLEFTRKHATFGLNLTRGGDHVYKLSSKTTAGPPGARSIRTPVLARSAPVAFVSGTAANG